MPSLGLCHPARDHSSPPPHRGYARVNNTPIINVTYNHIKKSNLTANYDLQKTHQSVYKHTNNIAQFLHHSPETISDRDHHPLLSLQVHVKRKIAVWIPDYESSRRAILGTVMPTPHGSQQGRFRSMAWLGCKKDHSPTCCSKVYLINRPAFLYLSSCLRAKALR